MVWRNRALSWFGLGDTAFGALRSLVLHWLQDTAQPGSRWACDIWQGMVEQGGTMWLGAAQPGSELAAGRSPAWQQVGM